MSLRHSRPESPSSSVSFRVTAGESPDSVRLSRIGAASKHGVLVVGDARDVIPALPKGSVTAWITSPPYFGLKRYGRRRGIGDEASYEDYLAAIRTVARQMLVPSSDATCLWLVADHVKHGGTLKLLPFDLSKEFERVGWTLRDVFIWNKHKALPWSRPGELRNGFEHILFFTKGSSFKFHVDRVRDRNDLQSYWVKYPERYNPRGKVPDGVWEFNIPTQGSWNRTQVGHPCPFPPSLVERMVLLSTDKGDLVVDPFAGTGVVVAQAAAMGRRALGVEIEEKYTKAFASLREVALRREEKRDDSGVTAWGFEKRIWLLRELKFTREVLRLLCQTHGVARVRTASIEERPSNSSMRRAVRVSLLVDRGRNVDRVRKAAARILKVPPLSKYQIDAEIVVADSPWRWPSGPVWVYRYGRFWDCAGRVRNWREANALADASTRTLPPMLSAIQIKMAETTE